MYFVYDSFDFQLNHTKQIRLGVKPADDCLFGDMKSGSWHSETHPRPQEKYRFYFNN